MVIVARQIDCHWIEIALQSIVADVIMAQRRQLSKSIT